MICRDGSVGAAGQTAPTKSYEPPLKIDSIVVLVDILSAHACYHAPAPTWAARVPTSSSATLVRYGMAVGSGGARAHEAEEGHWRVRRQ